VPAAPRDDVQSLIAAARQEGQLNLVWSENSFGGAEGVRRWTEGFNRLYGLELATRFTPGPAPSEVATRTIQEYQSNRPSWTDILSLGASPLASILDVDVLQPTDWTSWAPNVQHADLVALDGAAVEVSMRTPGITYNTSKFTADTAPRSLADLLKPEYRGRIASTPYASGFDWLATNDFWGEARTMDYVGKLANQVAGLIRCGEMQRVASGEFDILAIDCGSYEAAKAQRRGVPLISVVPSDLAAITYFYMSVPKNAAHPAAAKLWINYMLSREAQDVLWEFEAHDHYRLPGSHQASTVEQLQARGVQLVQVDVGFFQRHDARELERLSEQQQRILRQQ
jgi:ABC-type Fe3+ transport system substrate-binding protein